MQHRWARLAAGAIAVAVAMGLFGQSVRAEDGGSRDRAEFDAAAGRAMLFEGTSIADNDPLRARPTEARSAIARPPAPQRRAVRVILPSPYAR